MMIKLKRLFKQLKETTTPTTGTVQVNDLKTAEELAKKGLNVSLETEGLVDEARLVNHVHEYRGGVEYVLRDPSTAKSVVAEITRWTERKGFTIVKREITKQGKVGYFYFRMGEDPGTEAQRIQGYFSQMPEIKKFRFKVKNEQPAQPVRQQAPPAPQPEI
jgi:predicted DNA-binding transcriptional regulator